MTEKELLNIEISNDRLEEFLDIIDNGHPSIDENHELYSQIVNLSKLNGCELLLLFLK